MSEYTTDQILDMIESIESPRKLNLFGAELVGIDLSKETIQDKYRSRGWPRDGKGPPWHSSATQGINLAGANLQNAFLAVAKLQGATLYQANLYQAILFGANLQGAILWFANLKGTDLQRSELQEVDLEVTQSLEGAFFAGAQLHFTRLRADQIKQVGEETGRDYGRARRAYLGLKVNFREIGYYDDARWAYLKERRMERKTCFPIKEGEDWVWGKLKHMPLNKGERLLRKWYEGWLYTRLFLKPPLNVKFHRRAWLWSLAQDFFTEYMESWQRIIWRLIVPTPLIFTLFYWWTKGVINILPGAPPVSPMDYLFFSLRTLVTLAYSDFTPVGAGQWLAPIEGALGIIFLALLGFS
ncbi:MAG: pentapeptide repeat-containing protein, partial [Dehalococcoidia bacterium]|nr:pentapeptide repeat-containing protein [Dehalococcoidia bacterium]